MKKLAELLWDSEKQDFVYWEDNVRRRIPTERLVPIGRPVVTKIEIKNLSSGAVRTHPLPEGKVVESLEQAINHLREWERADLDSIEAYCASDEGTIRKGSDGEHSSIINAYQFYRIKDRDSLLIDKGYEVIFQGRKLDR